MLRFIISFLTIGLLLAVVPNSQMQESKPSPGAEARAECGTVVTAKQIRAERERLAWGGYARLEPQANRPYQIPLTIHIVRRDDGTGGFSLDNLQTAMQGLNQLWLPVGIQFYQRGAVDYINNDYYFVMLYDQSHRDELRQVNPVADTINVYFTNLTYYCGESTFSAFPVQGVLMDNECGEIGRVFAHEIGHYFDLYHTHEIKFGTECPSGSNCSTAGDLLCDTAADPELDVTTVTEACVWTGTTTNNCSMFPYNPPTRNLMSYSRRTCINQFTIEQTIKALNILITAGNRRNLINVSKYVAPNGSLTSACTYQNPCRTLAHAVQIANPGDHIFLLSGNYNGAITVNKAVFLKKWNTDAGTVTIGQ